MGIQNPDFGSRFLLYPLPEQPGQVPAHALREVSAFVGSFQAQGQQLQKELALLDLPHGWLDSGCSVTQGMEAKVLPSGSSSSRGDTKLLAFTGKAWETLV